MNKLLVALALSMSLFAACAGDRAAPPALVAPTATAEPALVGPLLVYESNGDTRTGVVYDIGAQRELWRVEPRGSFVLAPGRGTVVELFGTTSGTEVRERALTDGGGQRTLYRSEQPITGIAVSPDGTLLAFGTTDGDDDHSPAQIHLLDLVSGKVRELVRFENPPGTLEIVGQPRPILWRSDGAGIVFRYHPGGGPALFLATAMTDGRLVDNRLFAYYVSPDGRYGLHDGSTTVGCLLETPQRMRIIDLMTGDDVAVLEDAARGLRFAEWSPDGGTLLYHQYDTFDIGPGTCVPGLIQSSRRAMLLTVTDGERTLVDEVAVRRSWHEGHEINVTCLAELYASGQCEAEQALTADGREIARARGFSIVRVIPLPPVSIGTP